MTLDEFFKWLGEQCLNEDGSTYLRPEFLWYDNVKKYYIDAVMDRPVYERVMEHWNLNEHWRINFMLSPYANRVEFPRLNNIMNATVREQDKCSISTEKHLRKLPVEFWFMETPDSYAKVKVTAMEEKFPWPANHRKFLIEYDR